MGQRRRARGDDPVSGALSTAVAQSPLAALIEEREELAASVASRKRQLKTTHPWDIKARKAEQKQARIGLGARADSLRNEVADLAYAERERVQLLAMATCNSTRNMLKAASSTYYSQTPEQEIQYKLDQIAAIAEQLAQPDPELVDPKVEITNALAVCEQRLSVVKTQIKVLIP